MKNSRFLLPLLGILAVCAMLGCPGPTTPYVPPQKPAETFDPSVLHPLRTAVPDDFIRGADISNCLEIEQHGGVYRNFDGKVEDIMKILTDNGVNYVRVRLWIDPTKHPEHYAGDGNNHIGVTKVIAARAKAAGMKFLLDYHFSDWWADPQDQPIPYDWKDIQTRDEMYFALYNYVKDTVRELRAAGAEPDMVQLGNEIRSGFLRDHKGASLDGTGVRLSTWADWSMALSYGSTAVREAAPNAKIMIQFDSGGDAGILSTFERFTLRIDTGAPAGNTEVDYDVVGLSWYPFWSSHRSIDALYNNIREFKSRFGKEVVVCESGYSWTLENFDSMGNYVGMQQENASAAPMTNENGFTSDSGVLFGTRPDGTRYLPSTPENQARVYRAFMDAVVAAGGDGVMWWGADWIAPVPGLRSNSEMATLFDNTGKALPVMKVLGGIKGADIERPGIVTGLKAASTNGAVILSWDAVNAAIASGYQLERATAAGGPWTTVSDNLQDGSYTDTGLVKGTTYYYRIKAYNYNGWGDYCKPAAAASFIPTGLSITSTADTAALTWNALIGADKYEVSRAPAAAGPWTSVTDNVTDTTYTDTGLSPATAYYYRVRAFSDDWGDYCDPVKTDTLPLVVPEYFRVTRSAAASLTLAWNAVDGAASYKLYGVQSTTVPANDSGYTLVGDTISDTTYTHSGLTSGATWWYKVSAVYAVHGEGPKSAAISFTVGNEVVFHSNVNMASGTLDFAFSDPDKAESTTDVRPKVDSSAVYTFNALYVANDAVNLYVAMSVPMTFGAYRWDRIVLLVDNTSSELGTGTQPETPDSDDRICLDETIAGSVEARVYLKMGDWEEGPKGVEGARQNITEWSVTSDVYSPAAPAGSPQVIKFAIPLAGIDNAVKGTELKVAAFFSMGWDEGVHTYPGSFAPRSAVTGYSDEWDSPPTAYINIDMDGALLYTVK